MNRRVVTALTSATKKIFEFYFPPLCPACKDELIGNGAKLCEKCFAEIEPILSPRCKICGRPFLFGNQKDHTCGECLTTRPHFDSAFSAFSYSGPISQLIWELKYNRQIMAAKILSALLVEQIQEEGIDLAEYDLIVPVPLHYLRLLERGYNQSTLIAEEFSKALEIEFKPQTVKRLKATKTQTSFTGIERRKNIKGAFAVTKPDMVKSKKIIIIDDVYTTGSTLNELSKVLKKNGATKCFCITVGRVVMDLWQ